MKIIKQKLTDVLVGMTCDCCKKDSRDSQCSNYFVIEHTFGYDSVCDMTSVAATICEDCFLSIILDKIPYAQFKNHFNWAGPVNLDLLKKRVAANIRGENWQEIKE